MTRLFFFYCVLLMDNLKDLKNCMNCKNRTETTISRSAVLWHASRRHNQTHVPWTIWDPNTGRCLQTMSLDSFRLFSLDSIMHIGTKASLHFALVSLFILRLDLRSKESGYRGTGRKLLRLLEDHGSRASGVWARIISQKDHTEAAHNDTLALVCKFGTLVILNSQPTRVHCLPERSKRKRENE